MDITKEQARELARHGTLELPNGMTLRYRQEQDDTTTVNNYDYLGKVAVISRWESQSQRPEGFDGMAEKISTQWDTFWWQPPDDLRKGWVTYEHKNHLRNAVRDVLSYGFQVLFVELCDGDDAYGNPVVVDYACLGGVEPFTDDDDVAEYVHDLVYEVNVREMEWMVPA